MFHCLAVLLENTEIKQVFIFEMCRPVWYLCLVVMETPFKRPRPHPHPTGSASALPDSFLSRFVWFHQGDWLLQVRVLEWCVWPPGMFLSRLLVAEKWPYISKHLQICLFLHPYSPSPMILMVRKVHTEPSKETAVVSMVITYYICFPRLQWSPGYLTLSSHSRNAKRHVGRPRFHTCTPILRVHSTDGSKRWVWKVTRLHLRGRNKMPLCESADI